MGRKWVMREMGYCLWQKEGLPTLEPDICLEDQQGPDTRASDIPLHCSHAHEVSDKPAQPCPYLSQRPEHQRSRCLLLSAAHVLEVGKLFLAEIQRASLPAKVFIAEEARELLGDLKTFKILVNSKLLQNGI